MTSGRAVDRRDESRRRLGSRAVNADSWACFVIATGLGPIGSGCKFMRVLEAPAGQRLEVEVESRRIEVEIGTRRREQRDSGTA